MYEKLIHCPLFMGLKPEEITHLLGVITHQVKKYKKNQIIAFSDDEVISQLILLEGNVKGEMTDYTGKVIKIEDIESPRPLAPAFLFGNNNKYPVNIIANNNVTVLSLPKNSFIRLLQLNETILKNFLNNVSNRAQFLSNKIKFLSFQTIKGKLAHYILQLSKKINSDRVVLPVSQSKLAEMFGVARPSLARALRELDRDGYINASVKNINILNPQGLSKLIR